MNNQDTESVQTLLGRLVSTHVGVSQSLTHFWDRLVADGFTTSANDARRVLEMVGAYADPRVPFSQSTPTRINGVDTDHKRAIMRVTANIREAQRRASSVGQSARSDDDGLRAVRAAIRRALAAGIDADRITDAVLGELLGSQSTQSADGVRG